MSTSSKSISLNVVVRPDFAQAWERALDLRPTSGSCLAYWLLWRVPLPVRGSSAVRAAPIGTRLRVTFHAHHADRLRAEAGPVPVRRYALDRLREELGLHVKDRTAKPDRSDRYDYTVPESECDLSTAMRRACDARGSGPASTVRFILWGMTDVRRGEGQRTEPAVQVSAAFQGVDAVRIKTEAQDAGQTVREHITRRLAAALGVEVHKSVFRDVRMCDRAPKPRGRRARAGRIADSRPTQAKGGPYWPNPERRARDESRAVG